MYNSIRTVLDNSSGEYEEKRSRFLSWAFPVSSEDAVFSHLASLKKKYYDARHHCYAYIIESETEIQRFSDDGEPSGTAGLPVLEVIKRMEVRNLAVVVTRYFGGTLLGASGLIRAYSRSASLGIEAAQIVTKKLCKEITVILDYTLLGKVQSLLLSKGFPIKDTVYEQDVKIIVFIPEDEVESFISLITETTNAKATMEMGQKTYITLDSQGKIIL